MDMPRIMVDQDTCTRCDACVALCTAVRVFRRVEERVEAVAPEWCWLCGHCVAVCPADAIDHSEFPLSDCPQLDPDTLPSLDGLVTAFRGRRSTRIFREKPVPREVVRELADLARWAPSASNMQPVDWLAFDDPDRIAALSAGTVAALAQMAGATSLGEETAADFKRLKRQHARGADPIFYRAPVVLLAHAPKGDTFGFGRDDAVYAAYNLMLGAERMGLGTCLIGYLIAALGISRELRGMLGLPQGRRVEAALALGYPRYRFRRLIPRRRMDLSWNPEVDDGTV